MVWKQAVKKLVGQPDPPQQRIDTDALERDWTFRPSPADILTRLVRWTAPRRMVPSPDSLILVPMTASPVWTLYFVYAPTGNLTPAHHYTLQRLHAAPGALAIVCATATRGVVPDELRNYADALYWKDLSGFDFSAYALGLDEVARHSPGADVLVLNDSVFGPFAPIDRLALRWDLAGFTASARSNNHLQSYAFHLRRWDSGRQRALGDIFSGQKAFNTYRDTVCGAETLFASKAAHQMSVGALWYADGIRAGDPSVYAALPLVRSGFPFLKKSLLTRNRHVYDASDVLQVLRDHGHPTEKLDA